MGWSRLSKARLSNLVATDAPSGVCKILGCYNNGVGGQLDPYAAEFLADSQPENITTPPNAYRKIIPLSRQKISYVNFVLYMLSCLDNLAHITPSQHAAFLQHA